MHLISCLANTSYLSSGVAKISCEKGHETKKK